ncbi:MAG: choline sulfatase, partial [Opitutaceae bacterium]
ESIVALLEDPEFDRKVPAVISVPNGKAMGVVLDQWHYIQYKDGSEELYDHSIDPKEHSNLLYPKNILEKHIAIAKQLAKHIPENAFQGGGEE